MTDKDFQDELLELAQINARAASLSLRLNIQRFWSEELAKPRNADPKRLAANGAKVFSQNEEDGMIQEVFRRIGTGQRTFIEFGVETGVQCNTVKLLLEGWRGLWLEGSATDVAEIRRRWGAIMSNGALKLKEAMVTAENVNDLFRSPDFSGEIDLLSIDIDFNDYWVWKAIEVIKPRLVVIEYNATLRPPMSLTVPYQPTKHWDGTNYFGASLEALVKLGQAKGYRIVGCNFSGTNAFFVRGTICAATISSTPATAEEHYEPPRYYFASLNVGHPGRVGLYVTVSQRSSQFGSRFSMKAQMPSSASRAIMFSVITSEA